MTCALEMTIRVSNKNILPKMQKKIVSKALHQKAKQTNKKKNNLSSFFIFFLSFFLSPSGSGLWGSDEKDMGLLCKGKLVLEIVVGTCLCADLREPGKCF